MTADPTTISRGEHEDLAVSTAREQVPGIDEGAMRVGLNLVRASNRLITEAESGIQRAEKLSWPSFRVLFIVWMYGEIEARSIARITGVARQTVSSVLSTVERYGYVERKKANGQDRRLIRVRLTAPGREAVRHAFMLHNQVEARLFSRLTVDEQQQLAGLLGKLVDDPHGCRPHPVTSRVRPTAVIWRRGGFSPVQCEGQHAPCTHASRAYTA
ncbi:MarR family winged helix-turn-helix transcriptional regulator [Streptomyces sp. NEAU-YJ-81]|uniref:MarR family winged helix-turn-helix transcriptional regulator n=1 Tax=Streptomyces sp. NEAU-YJ-81 TaxID=2820288 RepID=UPI001ABD0D53|nr:MarR family winged helix-turn-helix transcriptional regulator [Streptomyces sp. NEAU-YJ-81]MBO3682259.1 winged helix-turn-helix transcriptional regulator [Streptomyces sp. NEAU-YJ-81]